MFRKRLVSGLGISTFVIAASMLVSSCSNKITDEQLAQLRDLRSRERNLSESIQKRTDDKNRIERELNARKNDVTKCQQEVAEVRTRLSSWPDIWPDYKPAAPAPEGNIQSQPGKQTTPSDTLKKRRR